MSLEQAVEKLADAVTRQAIAIERLLGMNSPVEVPAVPTPISEKAETPAKKKPTKPKAEAPTPVNEPEPKEDKVPNLMSPEPQAPAKTSDDVLPVKDTYTVDDVRNAMRLFVRAFDYETGVALVKKVTGGKATQIKAIEEKDYAAVVDTIRHNLENAKK